MVSIVVPIYNGELYISQMYRQLCAAAEPLSEEGVQAEFLFVNDGSKDGSAGILDELTGKDKRVRILHRENGGIAAARNAGLGMARGEYICFVDQDDIIKPDMLQVLLSDITAYGADMVQATASSVKNGAESAGCDEISCKCVEAGSEEYRKYLQALVMRGLVSYPECWISGSVWCCMFRTDFLRENNISFYSFCDYEDDWVFVTLALANAKRACFEKKTVYCWVIHEHSESHNRIAEDRYLDDFYEKHRLLRAFFLEALKNADLSEAQKARFLCEQQKQALLWALSNETGRGINKHSKEEIVAILSKVVENEKSDGICKGINRHPLYISTAGVHGAKKIYYAVRDKLLTFLLLHNAISLAVQLNKKVLHGRWHI